MICLVTDRRRRAIVEQVKEAVAAGIDLVQIRERDLEAAALAAIVKEAVSISRGSATRIVVNDRLDVALACAAGGVHLRGDSLSTAAARRITPPGFVVGRSVHSVQEAASAGDLDYVIAGTLFSSASKPSAERFLGVDGLRAVVAAARVPVLGIGGVTLEKLDDIAATGAAGVAAIGLFDGSQPFHNIVRTLRQRFDSVKTPS
jgi:thiamine-phosphate pyrophosphorylase